MATIQGIYIALFGRPADPAGLTFFNEATNNGADLTAIGDLASTDEYQSRFTGMSNEEIVNSIYQSLFGRDGEQAGIDFFVAGLEDGTFNINNIAIAILDGAQGDDLATVNAKIAAANIFTAHLDLDIEVDAYQGGFAASVGRDFINTVNKDDAGTEEEADTAILRLLDQGQTPDNGGGTGGGGGGGGNAPNFFVTEVNGEVVFSGTATGPITYTTDGNGVTTFFREGVNGSNTISDLTLKPISLAAGQELHIDGDQADNQAISGAGTVVINGLDSDDDTSSITATGTATLDGDVDIALSNWVPSKTIAIEVAAGQTFTLDSDQANGLTISGAGKTVVEAWTSTTDDNISVLTSGGNTINAGAGADTIVSGAGNDVLDGGDVVVPGNGGVAETFRFNINRNELDTVNTFQISGGGLPAPVIITVRPTGTSDASDLAVANTIAETLNTNYSQYVTASVGGAGNFITLASKSMGDQPDFAVAPVAHEVAYFRVTDGDTNPINVTLTSGSFESGSLTVNVDANGNGNGSFASALVAAINGTSATSGVAASVGGFGDYVVVTWLTPGDKQPITVTDSNPHQVSFASVEYTTINGEIVASEKITDGSYAPPSITEASVDVLEGGAGADEYRFEASTLTAVDQIVGFNADEDTIIFGTGTGAITYAGEWTVDQNLSLSDAVNELLASVQSASNQVGLVVHDGKQYLLLDGNGDAVFDEVVDQIVEVTGWSGTLNSADFSYA